MITKTSVYNAIEHALNKLEWSVMILHDDYIVFRDYDGNEFAVIIADNNKE